MTVESIRRKCSSFLWIMPLAVVVLLPMRSHAALEQTFPVLKIGTQVYSNVTVTTKSKTYVFLLHSAGMANIKVSELSPELKETLGYGTPVTATKNTATAAANWARAEMTKLNIPTVQARNLRDETQVRMDKLKGMPRTHLYIGLGVLLIFWLVRCACHAVICQKAGSEPGVLIWMPLLKLIPLLRAAQMSMGWLFLILIPFGAFVLDIIWCFKISAARGKGALTGLCLVIPVINFFAFFYLVFADGETSPKSERSRSRMMSLEAA